MNLRRDRMEATEWRVPYGIAGVQIKGQPRTLIAGAVIGGSVPALSRWSWATERHRDVRGNAVQAGVGAWQYVCQSGVGLHRRKPNLATTPARYLAL